MAGIERLIPPGVLISPRIEGITGQLTQLAEYTEQGVAQREELDRAADAHKIEVAELEAKFAEATDLKRFSLKGTEEHIRNLATQITSTIFGYYSDQGDVESDMIYVTSLIGSKRKGGVLDFEAAEQSLQRFEALQLGASILIGRYEGDSLEEATDISFLRGGCSWPKAHH